MTDFAEALANTVIGFGISWAATWLVLGYSAAGSIAVTLLFAGLSLTRSWAIRAYFRRMG